MSEIARLERDIEILNKRVHKLEADAQIKKLLAVEHPPEVKALLEVLKHLPQMAPYTDLDE